ncbi:hypothetical protein ACTJJ7_16365 [Phyllobacterium sp. 22229]|uniref:hypothetical protein n=1 Tax=Phyllobacterium sp. 22229 TaxID=3453895 RepID=UPI003F86354C
MTDAEIAELFIVAAEIERKMPPAGERPAKLRSQSLAFVHDQADMNSWPAPHRKDDPLSTMIRRKREAGDQLEMGDHGRLDQDSRDFWDGKTDKLKPQDVTQWERCMDLIKLVKRERDRRCLWAWASSKAGGRAFSKWCRDIERVHRVYGIDCKKRALLEISFALRCKPLQHNDNATLATLQPDTEIGHISDTIADHDNEAKQPTHWMADDAKPLAFDEKLQDFSYYEGRKEQRRQREEKLRQRAA